MEVIKVRAVRAFIRVTQWEFCSQVVAASPCKEPGTEPCWGLAWEHPEWWCWAAWLLGKHPFQAELHFVALLPESEVQWRYILCWGGNFYFPQLVALYWNVHLMKLKINLYKAGNKTLYFTEGKWCNVLQRQVYCFLPVRILSNL